ncbi:alpha-E domain-containing protein [Microbaculum marinisediminis]|uniref:Alpha-E domain-containing protein n=1 Tax=Microbaculum marinisediminis TaxID=2931392 RepID=A0AAW5R0M8_9HYPH|nr:alpha-E domain-containing protein [Microbaculum sp. A6E488]MCT8972880.1 alpha-E domain-containing protein [Microbaculum sp. A6E488]
MLSRTADNLFWMSRYVERAESIARILHAASRMAAVPIAEDTDSNEWQSALAAAACDQAFAATGQEATAENVFEYLAFSEDNPSSVRNCLRMARTNARAVRTALTTDTWEAINSAWLELHRYRTDDVSPSGLNRFIAWVKETSLRVDGAAYRTMLRHDAYWFSRLGVYLERADNTARILDVKYHVLLPPSVHVGGGLDFFQWSTILRSVSALTAYHWVYRDKLQPWLIADLLILREEMPRSLASCYANLTMFLDELARDYGRQGESQRHARRICAQLRNARTDDIFQGGLHEFLTEFITENNRLGALIADQYLI